MEEMKDIDSELGSRRRYNRWVFFPEHGASLYYRCTTRYLDGALRDTFDLATISIEENSRGRGGFTEILGKIEELVDKHNRYLYVENILMPRFQEFFWKRGYTRIGENESPCAFRIPKLRA